ncbi:hypothetical protein JYU20_00870 [Bacteroidales bacterium AH-315-I05]|nr:hypothetical protein [Bacteroidales bacterium AH-315-I05]
MLQKIHKSKWTKALAVYIGMSFLTQLCFPPDVLALTGGPSQPEVQSFEPVGTSEMVELSSGDFVYNIPLLDVGGYPVNLSYHAGIGMDQEASWVGLGWNINPGVISRFMRGLPDDFDGSKGDELTKQLHFKPNRTFGIRSGMGVEIGGLSGGINFGWGIFYNNYKGLGFEQSFGLGVSVTGTPLTLGLGLKSNSQEGLDIRPDIGLSAEVSFSDNFNANIGIGVGAAYNSREGLRALTFEASYSDTYMKAYTGGYGGGGVGFSTYVPIGTRSWIPQVLHPRLMAGADFRFTMGGEFFGFNPNYSINGYFSTQEILFPEQKLPAFGYLYAHKAAGNPKAVHDFNREKDGIFHTSTPNLPVTNFTYDLYSVTGQGIGSIYRPHRSDVGILHDNANFDISTGFNSSGELGLGNATHVGVNVDINFAFNTSGKWTADNVVNELLDFKGTGSDEYYEPFYFKRAGERSVNTLKGDAFDKAIGDESLLQLDLNVIQKTRVATDVFFNNQTLSVNNTSYRTDRKRRNESFSFLTAEEAAVNGLDNKVRVHTINDHDYTDGEYNLASSSIIDKDELSGVKPHHTSEITVLREDGARYVYGLPAYNKVQKEVTFNISQFRFDESKYTDNAFPNCSTGLVEYTPLFDNNPEENKRGVDEYYESKELPPYAHSYMLTAVISPDYVDNDGVKGPSPGDLGTYTKFNYSRVEDYHWRVPVEKNHASYNKGFKSDFVDDKASYLYGKKDVWYLHSIETKNYVAEFILGNDRKDGRGVGNDIADNEENGGISTGKHSQKLDEIRLFARQDKIQNGPNAKPLKVVHFVYDYSLCKGVPNNPAVNSGTTSTNQGGKLTLKKVFFTYEKSEKGRLNPYVFHYADPDHNLTTNNTEEKYNPDYSLTAYDRWGNYKENTAIDTDCDNLLLAPPNNEFPYVDQDKSNTDVYASAWNLHTIELPSGGILKIDYESDDYAYVQNKQAMHMFKVLGFKRLPVPNESLKQQLYAQTGAFNFESYNFMCVDLGEGAKDQNDFLNNYLGNIKNIYFKCMIRVGLGEEDYDYVPGYAEIENANIDLFSQDDVTGRYKQAFIQLKEVCINDKDIDESNCARVNPISKASWQMARTYLNKLIFPGSEPNTTSYKALAGMFTFITDMQVVFLGINRTLRRKSAGMDVQTARSWVRLHNPNYKKLGGGCRVAKISIDDTWDPIGANENSFDYGQEYDYTTRITLPAGNTKTISSGVASYEPLLGGEENPFRRPVPYSVKRVFYNNDELFQEEPFGENLLPSGSVVYSKVTVRNLQRKDASTGKLIVKKHATGRTEYEFFTAKDFPYTFSRTGAKKEPIKPKLINRIFNIKQKFHLTASQGYLVRLNDMHGKPKSVFVFGEDQDDSYISGIEYSYSDKGKNLDNEVKVYDHKKNETSNKIMARDIDLIMDMREHHSTNIGIQIQTNVDWSQAGAFPIIIPSVFVKESSGEHLFRSVVATKVIQEYGILESVTVYDQNSKVTTKNLLYDEETGDVLLTETINEYRDRVYDFTYPAHWTYDKMGLAYQNINIEVEGAVNASGEVIKKEFFSPGDEVMVTTPSGFIKSAKFWVIERESDGKYFLVDNEGKLPTTDLSGNKFKVIRSGRRNQQTTPIGSLTSLSSPVSGGSFGTLDEVLNANAIEFSDKWQMSCGGQKIIAGNCSCNQTNELSLFQSFINDLATNGDLVHPFGFLMTPSNYPNFTNSDLNFDKPNPGSYGTNLEKFQLAYSGKDINRQVFIKKSADQGFALFTSVSQNGVESFSLVKTDHNGRIEWANTYPTNKDVKAKAFELNEDGGYTMLGDVGQGLALILMKVDASGNVLWSKYIDNSEFGTAIKANDIIRTTNDYGHSPGYTLLGTVIFNNSIFIKKIDLSGNDVWTTILNKGIFDQSGTSIDIIRSNTTAEQGFIIGSTCSINFSNTDATAIADIVLTRVGTAGNSLGSTLYGRQGSGKHDKNPHVISIPSTAGGGFLIAATTYIHAQGNKDIMVFKTDNAGNVTDFEGIIDLVGDDVVNDVIYDENGGMLIVGNFKPSNLSNLFMMNVTSSGGINWVKGFEGHGDTYGNNAVLINTNASSGGFATAGRTVQGTIGDIFLIRSDISGIAGGCLETDYNRTINTESLFLGSFGQFESSLAVQTFANNSHVKTHTNLNKDVLCCSSNDLTATINMAHHPPCGFSLHHPNIASFCFSDIVGISNLAPVPNQFTCSDVFDFTCTAQLTSGLTVTLNGTNTCWPFANCTGVPDQITQCGLIPGDIINPYYQGIRGNWRPKKAHLYHDLREQASAQADISTDGRFNEASDQPVPFWGYDTGTEQWLPIHNTDHPNNSSSLVNNWILTSEITKTDPFGNELENKDAIERFSAGLYGYNNTLITAVASNARHTNVGFDNFEDYDYFSGDCDNSHFSFLLYKSKRDLNFAHTGRFSLKLTPGQSASVNKPVGGNDCERAQDNAPYTLKDCDCAGVFSPEAGKKYILGLWVRASETGAIGYPAIGAAVAVDATTIAPVSEQRSNVIDGWQRIEYLFEIPSSAGTSVEVSLQNSSAFDAYFDDVRIHEFDGVMKSFVYDPISLRLWAELDDRNFATFYEYDEEGMLVRVKKETERGIFTIQETRSSNKKQ